MKKKVIETAASKLELMGITLDESSLIRGEEDPLTYPSVVTQQSMMNVSAECISYNSDDKNIDIFRSYVHLGIRAVKEEESEEKEVFFAVEATYRVDYMLNDSLSDDEATEFSQFNSVHNVWPFWRQYVFETVRNADLPPLVVPLMRGVNIANAKKIKKSKV